MGIRVWQLYLFSRTTMFLCALNSTLLRSLSRRHRNKIPMTFSFFGRSHVHEGACEMNPDNKRDEDHSSRNQPPSICNPHLIPPHQPTLRVESNRETPHSQTHVFPHLPFAFFSSLHSLSVKTKGSVSRISQSHCWSNRSRLQAQLWIRGHEFEITIKILLAAGPAPR